MSKEACKLVNNLVRAIERNTKAGFERGKVNIRAEEKAIAELLQKLNGRKPTAAEIALAHSEIWPSL